MKPNNFWATMDQKMADASLAQNILRDLKSMKSLWNYLFMILFVWVVVWLVVKHAETCGNTAIVTVGSVVTAIFTNYVWSGHMDKRLSMTVPAIPDGVEEVPAAATGAAAAGEGDGNG
jgi:hypothetical protein